VTGSFGDRSLYVCTPLREDLVEFVTSCVRGGVDVVQLREKDRPDEEVLEAASQLAHRCGELGVPFIVNDRPDIAAAVGADGVHVGQEDVSPTLCRQLLGPSAIVGLSTHDAAQLDRAITEPVTYLSAGPVVPTPTKPGRPGTGLDYAALATARSPVPVFVTGGVSPSTVGELVARGVRRFVVVRWLTLAADPQGAARDLSGAIDAALVATRGA